jgi:hypothetical protein
VERADDVGYLVAVSKYLWFVLVAMTIGGGVTACGGGGGGGGGSHASSVAASSAPSASLASTTTTAPPATSTTTTDVGALTTQAKAINFTAADLPTGWTSSPSDNQSSAAEDAKVAACAGAPSPASVHLADVSSDDFSSGGLDVTSDVTVVRTAQLAQQDLAAIRSDRALACFRQLFPELAKTGAPANTQITVDSVDRLPVASYGDGSFGYRLAFTVQAPAAGTVHGVGDLIGFLHNRIEVGGNFLAIDAPFPASLEQALMAKLVARTSGRTT